MWCVTTNMNRILLFAMGWIRYDEASRIAELAAAAMAASLRRTNKRAE